ncbi:hypothetical protein GCM10017044_13960 [Kordiimonas sediminis]|uniref:Uncharacterized protein n=1 Tax=Kordiimonas sediminis TaxID=1735581 RepID=A0A919E564_9PROT|nr:hypothetical protein GCM10017044_13960 [Kordiimonas sediminis]
MEINTLISVLRLGLIVKFICQGYYEKYHMFQMGYAHIKYLILIIVDFRIPILKCLVLRRIVLPG